MHQDRATEIRSKVPLLMARYLGERPPEPKPKVKTQEWIDKTHKKNWLENAYFDEERGFYLPPENFEAMLFTAAKKQRQGQLFKEAVSVVEEFIPLIIYSSADDQKGRILKGKLEDYYRPEYIDLRGVVMKGSTGKQVRVDRCRPIFRYWGAKFTIRFESGSVEEQDVLAALECGHLGDFRPRFGRFHVVKFEPVGSVAAA